MDHNQTIIAQATPQGNGAIALIRVSGPESFALVNQMSNLPQSKKLIDQPTHTIQYGWVIDCKDSKIDQVLFFLMRSPHSFTGEDSIEITCHNNPFIVASIINRAVELGARIAQPGEFTQRAFENNKLDLVQAEAINELIHAQTESALKRSLAQLEGSLSRWITGIENELLIALAWCEASFEFLDDEGNFGAVIKEKLLGIAQTITYLKKTFDHQKQIREGFRIALIGGVNAGKSSLFNALLDQNRSIVTNIAGTTRDSIEAGLYRNGNHWTLIDTAGLRQTDDIIEKEGIKRAFEEAHKADIILLAIDSSRQSTDEEHHIYNDLLQKYTNKIIIIATKADLPSNNTFCATLNGVQAISLFKHKNSISLEKKIEKKIKALLVKADCPFLLNQRQISLILNLDQRIAHIITMLEHEIQYELVSYHLKECLENLSQLTGKSISEAAMDRIFKEFCVGK